MLAAGRAQRRRSGSTATVDLARLRHLRSSGEMRNYIDWPNQPGAAKLADKVEIVTLRASRLLQRPGDGDVGLQRLGAALDGHGFRLHRARHHHRPRPLAAAFHDRQHLADLGAGRRGVELGAAERVGDGLLARLVEQRLGLADLEVETRRLVGAER